MADDSKSLIAAGIFILISCTDWLDGYLARSRGEVTDFGKFMDPLADKILVAAALLALVELGSLPSWVVLVILAREFIVSGVRMVAASEGVVIAASWYGKFKTVFQMIAIVLFCIKDSHMVGGIGSAFSDGMWLLSWGVMIIALVLTVVSMLDYIAKARHLIGFGPKRKDIGIEDADDRALSAAQAASIAPEALDELAGRV
ncbi:CDP-diacylglycerol--glycerol-3-phosphate 3-phosphatidyltransferase, partial [Eggerthella sinensis]|uniref:CDP-diacylglycerol--glycerol-3-phosphate 3-phosphatidyltransferase n=1 Tax=Eggerthella sinensis TaxID=242230 RepID=UPI003A4D2019